MKIEYTDTNEQGLDRIKPLWQKLNELHKSRSRRYVAHFNRMTFDKRKEELLKKSAGGALHIDLAREAGTGELVGYCVSTVTAGNQGEIDSIFIEPRYRRCGIGDALMKKALKWLDGQSATRRIVVVAAGNEETFEFYSHYRFYPRAIILEQTGPD